MFRNLSSLACLLMLLLASCGGELSDQELLDRDRADLTRKLRTNKVLSYKFFKIAIRSSSPEPMPGHSQEFAAFRVKAADMYHRFISIDTVSPGIDDYLRIYLDYLALKSFVATTDEDMFPPMVEAIGYHGAIADSAPHKPFTNPERLLIMNVEHAALSVLVLATRDLGTSVSLYEISETETSLLPDGETKALLQLLRGFIFFEKGLYYLAEKELSDNIAWLIDHPKVEYDFAASLLGTRNPEHSNHVMMALHHLFRGIDRLMMEREIDEERALQDFEAFLHEAEKAGLDNELTWTIQAYVSMKREEHDKAIAALRKLRGSKVIGAKEKEAIDETIGYLENRQAGKALNGVFDNVFMARVIIQYSIALLAEVDWREVMKENDIPYAEESWATVDRLEGIVKGIDQYTSYDSLSAKGEGLVKEVAEEGSELLKGAEEEGKGLVKKVEEWWK